MLGSSWCCGQGVTKVGRLIVLGGQGVTKDWVAHGVGAGRGNRQRGRRGLAP